MKGRVNSADTPQEPEDGRIRSAADRQITAILGKRLSQHGEGHFPCTGKGAFPTAGRLLSQWLAFVIPNTSSCHSEHREESREGKEKKFFAYALNDILMVNC